MVLCNTEGESERPFPPPATEIVALVRAVLEGSCSLIPTSHFKKRGRERHFSVQDALEVLRTGTVIPTPLWNDKTESGNHDIAGTDIEGEALTVRVAQASSPLGLVLVTAF